MDELVERVAQAIAWQQWAARNPELAEHATGRIVPDCYDIAAARAIIPIVADWQRERDAGIAEQKFAATGWHPNYYFAGSSIATAIRGAK